MAGITFVAAGAVDLQLSGASPGYPAGMLSNDIIILCIQGDGGGGADGQGDFGGTLIETGDAQGTSTRSAQITAYWKRATGAESGTITTDDAGDHTYAQMVAFRGCRKRGSPIDGTPVVDFDAANDGAMAHDGCVTGEDNSMVCWVSGTGRNNGRNVMTNSVWESKNVGFVASSTIGNDGSVALHYGLNATAGATGECTNTYAGDSAADVGITFALLSGEGDPSLVEFISAGTIAFGTSSASVAPPPTYEANDVLILQISSSSADDAPADQGAFGGTLVGWVRNDASLTVRAHTTVYWKRAVATEVNVTVSDSSSWIGGVVSAYRGCRQFGNPIDAFATSQDPNLLSTVTMTGLTTAGPEGMIVFATAAGDDSAAHTPIATPGSPVTQWSGITTLGNDGSLMGGNYLKETAGATGDITATQPGVETQANIVLALLPEVAISPAVLSVERFSLSMPDATVSTPALSLGQDINNCVPFMTVSTDNDTNRAQMVDVAKNTGTDKFDFTAHADGARNLEVAIVEFDPAEVAVQEVAWFHAGTSTHNVTISAAVVANTFPVVYAKVPTNWTAYNKILYRATLTSPTNLLVAKHVTDDISGHAYILEALNAAWSIETGESIPFSLATGATTANATIDVVASRAGCWSYWKTSEAADDPRDAIWDAGITDNANLDLTRGNTGSPSATADAEVFVVNFAPTVAVVQQGELNYAAATTKTGAINAPGDLANAMVVATSPIGWLENNGITGAKASDLGRMKFNSATEILGTRGGVGSGGYRQNYQVIEWLIGGSSLPYIQHIGV